MSESLRVGLLLGDRPDLLEAVAHADGVVIAAIACNSDATAAAASRLAAARAFPAGDHVDRDARDAAIGEFLAGHRASLIVTAGWLWLLGPALLRAFGYLAVNVHPTLLPAFPGRHSVERAVRAGARRHGATIHFIDDGIDTGTPIAQTALAAPIPLSAAEIRRALAPLEARLLRDVLPHIRRQDVPDPSPPRGQRKR